MEKNIPFFAEDAGRRMNRVVDNSKNILAFAQDRDVTISKWMLEGRKSNLVRRIENSSTEPKNCQQLSKGPSRENGLILSTIHCIA